MEEEYVKILPSDVNAEKALIGSMLMNVEAITSTAELLSPDDFYYHQYGVMFESMVELMNEGKPANDPILLQEKLREKGVPESMGGVAVLTDLLDSVPMSVNSGQYAEIIKNKAILRRIIATNEEINKACYLAKDKVEDILAETEKKIFNLVQRGGSSEYVPIRDVAVEALRGISKAYQNRGNITGIETGFTDLDYKLSGLQPSDLILIAARPSMGKTAFVLNIAQHVAVTNHITTAIFSLEMSKVSLVNRMLSLESGVEAQNIRTGDITDGDWSKLVEGAEMIGRSNLIIDDTPGISIGEMRSKCRKYKLENNLGLVIIDYLQLMTGNAKAESNQQMISEISRSLKALARELNVPVIALSQLSRAVEKRDDKRPIMSDLRDSGAIEQDADVIMFIYREDYYVRDLEPEKRDISEIIIAKQRNGPIGTVRLAWIPKYTKFGNLERRRSQQDND
ncbi:MAG: replicative DNA helicase [Lachnospiraceae bacterium]